MEIIIIGGLHHNTLGVLRSIGERISRKDIIALIVCENPDKKNIISASKYILKDHLYYVDNYQDIMSWLKNYKKDGEKRVIISCADGVTAEIINHKAELIDCYHIPDAKVDILKLMSKETQAQFALNAGLQVPDGMILHKGDLLRWDCFPCIIKPVNSTIGAGKADIHVVSSCIELEKILSTVQTNEIQVQRYIKKKMEYQLIGCSINNGETIIIPGYTDIIRQPENTNTGYLEYLPIEGLKYDSVAVDNFIRSIGYSGLFSVEFIRDEMGRDYFLEINMRNDGNAYCVKSAGVNLPYIWYYYSANGELPKGEPLTIKKSIMFIPDLNDFMRGVKSVGLLGWLKQFVRADSHSVWDTHDMGPFWVQTGMFAKIAGKRIFKIK